MDTTYRKSYKLDDRFTVEFALQMQGKNPSFVATWLPYTPTKKKARRLLPEYRRARGEFLSSLGVRVGVIEI